MTRICSICLNANRLEIDKLILAQNPLASLSRQFGVSKDALFNHKRFHIHRQLIVHHDRIKLNEAMDVMGSLEDLVARTQKILDTAESKGQNIVALTAVRELRSTIETFSKIAFAMQAEANADQASKQNFSDAEIMSEQSDSFYTTMKKTLTPEEFQTYRKLTIKVMAAL